MTRDWHIIEMTEKQLEERIAEAVFAERKACVLVAEEIAAEVRLWKDGTEPEFFIPIAEGIARAIRKRGKK